MTPHERPARAKGRRTFLPTALTSIAVLASVALLVDATSARAAPPVEHLVRFRVTGDLDDPLLGKIEDAVTARMRELELDCVRVDRRGKHIIEVRYRGVDARADAAVKAALARPDRIVLATVATKGEVRLAFGPDFDREVLRRRIHEVALRPSTALGVALYRNPDDPTHPRAVGDEPLLYFHPWLVTGADGESPGVLVTARPELRCTREEIENITLWDAKLTGGMDFVLKSEARKRLRELITQGGEICAILNGRSAVRLLPCGGPMAAATSYGRSRISVLTSALGSDMSRRVSMFRKWVMGGGDGRTLVPIHVGARPEKQ